MSKQVLPDLGTGSGPPSLTTLNEQCGIYCSLQTPNLCYNVSYPSVCTHAAHLARQMLPKPPTLPLPQPHHLPGRRLLITASVKQPQGEAGWATSQLGLASCFQHRVSYSTSLCLSPHHQNVKGNNT